MTETPPPPPIFLQVPHCCAFVLLQVWKLYLVPGDGPSNFPSVGRRGWEARPRAGTKRRGWKSRAPFSHRPVGMGEKTATCCCWRGPLPLRWRRGGQQHPRGFVMPSAQHQRAVTLWDLGPLSPTEEAAAGKWSRVSIRLNQPCVSLKKKKNKNQCIQNEVKLVIGSHRRDKSEGST